MTILISATRVRALRAGMATLCMTVGTGIAASEPPAADPAAANNAAASTAQPAPSRSAPIPLNSGVSHEFDVDPSKITMEVLPNGTRLYHMNGQGMQSLTAQLGADGKLELKCTDRAAETAPATQTAAEETANAHEQYKLKYGRFQCRDLTRACCALGTRRQRRSRSTISMGLELASTTRLPFRPWAAIPAQRSANSV